MANLFLLPAYHTRPVPHAGTLMAVAGGASDPIVLPFWKADWLGRNSMSKYKHLEKMAPLLVQVELTESCNLTCRFCYNSQNPRYSSKTLDILDKLAEQRVMQVSLTGGEPLSHPDFFVILERACKLFPNVMILSNGTLMDEQTVERIHQHNVLSVSISIHGDPATHDALTGMPGSYNRSIKAIRSFLKRDGIPVASNFVLNAANSAHLSNTIEDMGTLGLKFMTITRFVPVGVGKDASDLVISRNQLVDALRIVHQHLQKEKPPHIEIAEATPFCTVPEYLKYLANTCSYGYDRFYVDVDGNLMVCGLSRIPIGNNVLRLNIRDIKASSPVYHTYLDDNHVPSECPECDDFHMCHGGCRAAAMFDGMWQGSRDFHMTKGARPTPPTREILKMATIK